MKTLRRSILPVLLLAVVLSGCATAPTPIKSTVLAFQAYTAIESGLIIEQKAGRLTAEQHTALEPYRAAARAGLDAAAKAVQTQDPTAISTAFAAAQAAVNAFVDASSRTTGGRVTTNTTLAPTP